MSDEEDRAFQKGFTDGRRNGIGAVRTMLKWYLDKEELPEAHEVLQEMMHRLWVLESIKEPITPEGRMRAEEEK